MVPEQIKAGYKLSAVITIENAEPFIYIPNAFSPNGDRTNDYFRIRIKDAAAISEFNIYIYDKLGGKVYESNDINQAWNGTFKGKPVNAGVYVYYVNVKPANTSLSDMPYKGNLTLIK